MTRQFSNVSSNRHILPIRNLWLGFGFLSLLVLLLILQPVFVVQAAGERGAGAVDPTFKSGAGPNGNVSSLAVQSDGKVIITGNFTTYNGTGIKPLVRLNPNGSVDSTFNVGTGADNTVSNLAVQNDDKIIIGGSFNTYNGTARNRIARLNADGTLDTSFNVGMGLNGSVSSIAVQSDGKVIIGGSFSAYNGIVRNSVARLNTDGTLDTTFNVGSGVNGSVSSLAVQSDSRIIIGGFFSSYNGTARNSVVRLNTNGTLDTSFNVGTGADSGVNSVAVQNDGKVVIGGQFTSYNGTNRNYIARLNTNGSLDTSFNVGSGTNNTVFSVAAQSDGKVIIGGNFTTYNGTNRNYIARVNADGTLDTTFNMGTGAYGGLRSIVIQNDGKILIDGNFTAYNGTGVKYLAKLNSNGTLDTAFNTGSGVNGGVYSIAAQSDGKILIGGFFSIYNGVGRNSVARLNTDGTLDTNFNPGNGANDTVSSLAVQSDGKILLAGNFTAYNGTARNRIARLNNDGTLDTNFNPGNGANDVVNSVVVQNDGKVVIGGFFSSYNGTTRNRVARLNTNGTLDTNFNPGSGVDFTVFSVAAQSDGKIIIGGNFTAYNGTTRNRVARLNTNGTLDTNFNPGSGANDTVSNLTIQSDGKILIGGNFTAYNGTTRNRVARLNSDGTLDTTFNVGNGADNRVLSVAAQNDGKVIIGGNFTAYNGTARNRIARLNNDGTLDTNFNPGNGADSSVYSIAIQSDSKIIIGGFFTSVDTYTRDKVARLEGINKLATAVTLVSTPNPGQFGQSVSFTATVTPITATGTVTFTFGTGIASTSVTSPLTGGIATYVTTTLPVGNIPVQASYSGDVNFAISTGEVYTQVIVAPCNHQVVTSPGDDGQATTCGTFSYALATTAGGIISFALAGGGDSITFTDSLIPALKPGVAIDGGANGIILNGNGVAGDGLRLGGGNTLTNLTIRDFGGRELLAMLSSAANQLFRVKVQG